MCGIGGFIEPKSKVAGDLQGSGGGYSSIDERLNAKASRLLDALEHRGPDDAGTFGDNAANLRLVHSRLAILDLSAQGHQPMSTTDGRFTIVFNGEIYNFRDLRDELVAQGAAFSSDSDTEVLLQLYARLGSQMLSRLKGMFALAIWDRVERSLFLARDPLGIKPLYLEIQEDSLVFASEIRALLACTERRSGFDLDALGHYLLMGSVQEPESLFAGIGQIPAGHYLIWKDGRSTIQRYWQLSYSQTIQDLSTTRQVTREALDDSINRHFVSDVPVGIFLSGGIDSTAILALAKANGYENLQTFCISFDENEFSEGDAARRTASHFGAKHRDWRLTADEAKPLIASYLECVDSPSNDGFNTFCISKMAHDHGFKVVLSGLGGDELFGGYPSFQRVPQLLKWHSFARPIAKPLLNHLAKVSPRKFSHKLDRLAAFAKSSGGPLAAYWTMRAFFTPDEAKTIVKELAGEDATGSLVQWLSTYGESSAQDENLVGYLETTRYMRSQLLRDSDVMSMAHGLELRVPLVDSALYDRVNSIAASIRYRPGKQLLLDAVPEIPSWVANQPKKGFRFPFETWMLAQFGDAFELLQKRTSVPLDSWYRKWLVFSLLQFVTRSELRLGPSITALP
jgi:asparagine synthase (glutamine-hydrolysing)